jgi:hypothetical protein
MIQGAEIAATLIYFIPAGVNFFLCGKPVISFYYAIIDIICFCDDQGPLNPSKYGYQKCQFTLPGIATAAI